MNLKRFLDWQKYRKESFLEHFFEGVDISDEVIKKNIIDWILRLETKKNIQIDSLSVLLAKYDKIVFPIKISRAPQHLELKDFNGNNFYLCYNQTYNPTTYYIGKRTKNFDKQLTFLLTKENEIWLKNFEIIKLDENGINTDTMVSFNYNLNDSTTIVILKSVLKNASMKLEIAYETIDFEHSDKISANLFELVHKCYYSDNILVLPEFLSESIKELLESKSILETTTSIKRI